MNPSKAFRLLSSSRRRNVLKLLAETDGVTSIEDISEQLASNHPKDTTGDIKTSLHHNHLPRLASWGAVEYDQRSGDVVATHKGDALQPLIRESDRLESKTMDTTTCD